MTPRVVVVGAGHLGTYHLEKLSDDPACDLVGVVEIDPERRSQAAARFGIRGSADLEAFAGQADAAVIATPTPTHKAVGLQAFSHGWHVLVEKPMAATVEGAEALLTAAAARGVMLQVGHTERFNPAMAAGLAVADRPRFIVAERLGPFTGRSTDVDVVLDLMIHDLDIVAHLSESELVEVRALGVPVLTNEVDMASARLAFADGTVAQLSAGRASLEPSRKVRLFTIERYVSIDCVARDVKSVRRLPPTSGSGWPELTGEPVSVPAGDSLALQDHHFIECVRNNQCPLVDGAAGVAALRLAHAVNEAMTIPLSPGQPQKIP